MSVEASGTPKALALMCLLAGALLLIAPTWQPTPFTAEEMVDLLPRDSDAGLSLDLGRTPPEIRHHLVRDFGVKNRARLVRASLKEHQISAQFYRHKPPRSRVHGHEEMLADFRPYDIGCFFWHSPAGEVRGYLRPLEHFLSFRFQVYSSWDWPSLGGKLDPHLLDFVDQSRPLNVLCDPSRLLEENPEIRALVTERLAPYHIRFDDLSQFLGNGALLVPSGEQGLLVIRLEDPSAFEKYLQKKLPPVMRGEVASYTRQGSTIQVALEGELAWCLVSDYLVVGLGNGLPRVERALVRRLEEHSRSLSLARDLLAKSPHAWAVRRQLPQRQSGIWLFSSGSNPSKMGKVLDGFGFIE